MVFTSPLGELPPVHAGNATAGFFMSPDLSARDRQDDPLFVDSASGKTITIAQFCRLVPRAAALLRSEYNVLQNDVVAVFGVNHLYTPAIHHATISLGATVSPANILYSSEELSHQLKMVKPKITIVFDPVEKIALEATKLAGVSTRLVKFSELFPRFERILGDPNAPEVQPVEVDGRTTPAYYCFSSGTSGLPKGVITTHYNILANSLQVASTQSRYFGPDLSQSCVLPMSHIFALNTSIWSGAYVGKKTVIFAKFDLEDFVSNVVKYKIAVLYLVPPIVLLLGKMPILEKYPEFGECVKLIASGAAPLSKDTIALVSARCPKVKVVQGYGLTETTPMTHLGATDTMPNYDEASIGWLVPGVDAKLVDPASGKEVTDWNKPGELWVRGPMVMAGYLNNKQATDECMTTDGYFKTGDVAIVKEDQQFYIVDRIKELIKSNGHQVAPAELEGILLNSPQVADAAVIGVYNQDKTSEMPRAYLVLQQGADPKEVAKWFNKRVAKHKRLWGGIVVVPQIPKSGSGKILRKDLRDRAAQDDKVVVATELASL